MGRNSRGTRFGQNSSGKRTTRSAATPTTVSSPINQPNPSASFSTITNRPGSSHRTHFPSHHGGGRASTTTKRKPPSPSSCHLPLQEEILAEIIVSTNGLDELNVDMSEDVVEVLDGALPSARPGTDAPESFLDFASSGISHVGEPSHQLLPMESASAEHAIFKPIVKSATPSTGITREQAPLRSSIHPSEVEDAVDEPLPQLDVGDDATQIARSEVEASMVEFPKNKTPTEPVQVDSLAAKSDIVTLATASIGAEPGWTKASQPEIQDVTPQLLPAGHGTLYPGPEDKAKTYTSLAKSISTVPDLDVPGVVEAKTEFIELQTTQSVVDHVDGHFSPAMEEVIPILNTQGRSTTKPFIDGCPTDRREPDTNRSVMISPTVQGGVKAEDTHSLHESPELDNVVEAGLKGGSSTTPGLNNKHTPGVAPPKALAEDSCPVVHRAFKSSNGAPSLSHRLEQSIPTKDSVSIGLWEEVDAPQSPTEQSEPMDTDLEDPAPSRGNVVFDLKESPLSLQLRQDSTIMSPIENLPPPIPSDAEPSSYGLLSNDDIEQAYEEAAKAGAKRAETPSTDADVGGSSISAGINQARTDTTSVLGPVLSPGPSETHETSETAASVLQPSGYADISHQTPTKSTLKQIVGESQASFASSSSLSALTDFSGLSSKPPSVSSKATTPFDAGSPRETLSHFTPGSTFQVRSSAPRLQFNVRPKVSIPADLTPQEYAMECIEAGENSRLNAYALHQEEYLMLRSHISHGQVTTYLNIRNGILRLWVRNPQIAVTREEAIGCAKDTRWFDVANVCFDWLVRRGYINYGCVEVRQSKSQVHHNQSRKRKTVVVIGAGFSGLGCARQLEGLFKQYTKRFRDMGEELPRVIVLEGRNRVGGRVYSRAFETLPATAPGVMRGRRFTAEMGGMIITGFERGNPLNILVRGQLGLPYHCLLADMSLHDSNGTNVDLQRDTLVEQLYNACLERVSEYKFKTQPAKLIEGNHDLMDEGRDSSAEGHKTIALVEETTAAQPHAPPVSEQNVAPRVDLVPVSTNRMTGKVHTEPGTAGSTKAAFKAKQIGWALKAGVSDTKDIDLDPAVNDPNSTLGSVLDNALMQHKDIVDLNAQDFRLFNWHIANLEYSNATNLNRLSSRGWDVDVGNEWDGRHTMVVGGYQSVARGLAMLPSPLDIRHKAIVKRIEYASEASPGPARITLEDGKSLEADYVVNTIPLGVLKHGNVEFQPPLPTWKTQAIERLGFGVLNKVILVYKEAFWDKDRDIFGMLQTPTNRSSLHQKDYASRRGRFFQWFSVTNTTGMPCLLALMAGDAAYDTEITPNDELIAEATEVLRMRYGARVMQPLEAIVTRWESDRFARGSYSNAGVNMQPDDYQLMARTIGNLYFAGEHTIVTHPATVHGAYLSGLRAASDVLDSILGPIDIPTPLVLPRETSASLKRKAQEEHKNPTHARLEAYEMEITEHIYANIGPYPLKPAKVAGNPYIIFNKANYEAGRKKCEEGRRAGKGKPSPNEVRTMTSKMWKEASPEVRKPFEDAADDQKRAFAKALREWTEAASKWEKDASELRERYMKEHPSIPGAEELAGRTNEWSGARRAKRVVESYREADSDIDMD